MSFLHRQCFINHNTEVKMAKITKFILQDIDKETVEWRDNFDGSLKEPVVLPAILPNLLINGSLVLRGYGNQHGSA